jgi:hypothetical protein
MSRVAPCLPVALLLLALLGLPTAASGAWGNVADEADGARLVSADYDRLEQGDDSTVFAAISGDGRYVAIQTRARNFFADDDPDPPGLYRAGGVFRFDLQTRALEKVADGDLFDEATNEFLRRGASNPSISANGRYVAFATAQPLIPADTNQNVDVYVRDMDVPYGGPGAFDLVSARDGSDLPASYGPPSIPFPGSEPGSDLTRGVALSADGQKVAFRTEVDTDLPASCGRTRRAGLRPRPEQRYDDAGDDPAKPRNRRDDLAAGGRRSQRGAQRRRDDGGLDGKKRRLADPVPRWREPGAQLPLLPVEANRRRPHCADQADHRPFRSG